MAQAAAHAHRAHPVVQADPAAVRLLDFPNRSNPAANLVDPTTLLQLQLAVTACTNPNEASTLES